VCARVHACMDSREVCAHKSVRVGVRGCKAHGGRNLLPCLMITSLCKQLACQLPAHTRCISIHKHARAHTHTHKLARQ
jgi:hypothetical protein